jgi:AcrR family transcriptional regulator
VISKTDLNRDAIVDRALAIADDEGIDAITIRRISKEFGVTPMALYWHVANKDELLDAMGDRIFASVQLSADDETVPWDDRLREIVAALVGAFRQHPTCTELVYRRIFASPDGREIAERTLRLLRRAGFGQRETADIGTYALQTAVMLVSADPCAEVGRTEEAVAAELDEKRAALGQLPADDYPFVREMAEDLLHCNDLDAYYRLGVDLFVSGAREQLANTRDKVGA